MKQYKHMGERFKEFIEYKKELQPLCLIQSNSSSLDSIHIT